MKTVRQRNRDAMYALEQRKVDIELKRARKRPEQFMPVKERLEYNRWKRRDWNAPLSAFVRGY